MRIKTPGKEYRHERDQRARNAAGRDGGGGPEVSREGEQRPGHGLRPPVTGEKGAVRNPPRRDNGVPQQRQNDMAAAENERP